MFSSSIHHYIIWPDKLIHLRRNYNFLLFHANIIQVLHTFGNFLYDLFGITYLSSAQCQFMFVAYFCITENPYQTKSKCNKISWRIILEYMWFSRVGITTIGGPHSPQDTRARQRPLARGGGLCPPRTLVGALLWAQGSLYPGKNRVKTWAQSELRISRNIRNGFRPDLGNAKQKRTEREIQSRRGSHPSHAMEAMDQRRNPPPI